MQSLKSELDIYCIYTPLALLPIPEKPKITRKSLPMTYITKGYQIPPAHCQFQPPLPRTSLLPSVPPNANIVININIKINPLVKRQRRVRSIIMYRYVFYLLPGV